MNPTNAFICINIKQINKGYEQKHYVNVMNAIISDRFI